MSIKTVRDLKESPNVFPLEVSKDFILNYYHHYFGVHLIQDVYEDKNLSNYKDAYVEALVDLLDEKLKPEDNVKYEILDSNIPLSQYEIEIKRNTFLLLNKETMFVKIFDKHDDYFVLQIELHWDEERLDNFYDTFYTKEEWLDYKKENGEKYQIKESEIGKIPKISSNIDEKVEKINLSQNTTLNL